MKDKVISKESATHYQWGAACDSWILADTIGLSIKQEKMPPATKEIKSIIML